MATHAEHTVPFCCPGHGPKPETARPVSQDGFVLFLCAWLVVTMSWLVSYYHPSPPSSFSFFPWHTHTQTSVPSWIRPTAKYVALGHSIYSVLEWVRSRRGHSCAPPAPSLASRQKPQMRCVPPGWKLRCRVTQRHRNLLLLKVQADVGCWGMCHLHQQ